MFKFQLAFLALFLLAHPFAAADDKCQRECSGAAVDPACYNDGKVYNSQCLANCLDKLRSDYTPSDPPLYSYYTCSALGSGVNCAEQCAADDAFYDCLGNAASSGYTGQVYCFKDGIVSSSLGKARCYDSSITGPLINCTQIGIMYSCKAKCLFYASVVKNVMCKDAPLNWQCGNDGVLCPNECSVAVAGKTIVSPAAGNNTADQAECANTARTAVGSGTGGSTTNSYANTYNNVGNTGN